MTTTTTPSPAPRPFLAAIGASAGGLEAIERFFRALPPDPGIAFVLVQHLSPDFESRMDELMARFSNLAVSPVEDGIEPRANHVYFMPAGQEMESKGGRLRLFPRDPNRSLTLPIDRFFVSVGLDHGRRAAAIILSGSGSDGARGARQIHESGGLVLVEDPAEARFSSMPSAVIEAGLADAVLPADQLAGWLVEHASHGDLAPDHDERALIDRAILTLRGAFSIDFAQYKLPTVVRRVRRRVALSQLPSLEQYIELLKTDESEVLALGHDLLIGVTRFYRDPATWETLEHDVLPRLIRDASPKRGLRAWVAGCATGEEAYSLAMSLLDATASRPELDVKVFATDVHRGALEHAARGVYADKSLGDIPEDRLNRYFMTRADGERQVRQELRNAVVFAPHNVLKDAPFTQLNLVTCRNLLIYLQPPAQRQALLMMQYGLLMGGILVLGPSESVGDSGADLKPVDEAHRIYTKTCHARRLPEPGAFRRREQTLVASVSRPRPEPDLLAAYDAVLDHVMPPSILVNADRRVLDCYGGAEKYLLTNPRRPSQDLLERVPESVRSILSGALARASREAATVRFESSTWSEHESLDIEIDPVRRRTKATGLLLLKLQATGAPREQHAPPARPFDALGASTERLHELELELDHTKASLQATVDELETSGEEMQAINEELVSSNEELQTTNQELHSVNEELHTVNSELQLKNQQLSDVNHDMRRLFEEIDTALIFLDGELRIRRFTAKAGALFGLMEHDAGRPLASFQHPLKRPQLLHDLQSCAQTGGVMEYEVDDIHGGTHLVRIHAHHSGGRKDVMLSITDLSALAEARYQAELLSAVVASSADAILALDREARITTWNQSAEKLYGYSKEEVLGQSIRLIVPPDKVDELEITLRGVWNGGVQTLETTRLTKSGERRAISTTISPVRNRDGIVVGGSKIDRDIGERMERERALAERERLLADLYDNSPDMFASVDLRTGMLVELNETLLRNTGYTREELDGTHVSQLYPPDRREEIRGLIGKLEETGELRDVELVWQRKDGSRFDVSLSATIHRDEDGRTTRSRSVIRDISARKSALRTLAEAVKIREQFLAVVSHELRTPLYAVRSAAEVLTKTEDDQESRSRALGVLNRQTAQMTRLLDDLLDVSLIARDQFKLERKPLDLRDAVRAAADAVALAKQGAHARISITGGEEPLPLIGDFARLQQVFTNLLTNAIRHSPLGEPVVIDIATHGQTAMVSVTDRGEGLSPERLERIFEPFSTQANHGTGRRLGIGLGVARRIVEGHGGTLTVTSPGLGHGCVFKIQLQLSKDAELQPSQRGSRSALHLVVIEDQEDSLTMITMLLEMRGYTVLGARDGESGIDLILRERPDVAIVDIGLPDVSGYEVAQRVRDAIGDTVPLLALTGYSQPEDVKKALDAGFTRHLPKPLDTSLLDAVLQELNRTTQ